MKEHRRVCHINAEQKRRCNIKNGFDMLQSLLPGGASGGGSSGSSGSSTSGSGGGSSSVHGKSSDVSKAAMLHRGAEYIRTLRTERQQQQEEMDQLKQNIEVLNSAIRYFDSFRRLSLTCPLTLTPLQNTHTHTLSSFILSVAVGVKLCCRPMEPLFRASEVTGCGKCSTSG